VLRDFLIDYHLITRVASTTLVFRASVFFRVREDGQIRASLGVVPIEIQIHVSDQE
jgi:hypothetical protein